MDELIRREKVEVRQYNVIYKLIDDLKDEISKRLPFIEVEESVGKLTHITLSFQYLYPLVIIFMNNFFSRGNCFTRI